VRKEIGVKLDNGHWYYHAETSFEAKVNVLWNQQLQTDRTIPNNKPAIIVLIMKKEHECK